jgi:hypothetical protein
MISRQNMVFSLILIPRYASGLRGVPKTIGARPLKYHVLLALFELLRLNERSK